jgi:hypothetical protein
MEAEPEEILYFRYFTAVAPAALNPIAALSPPTESTHKLASPYFSRIAD